MKNRALGVRLEIEVPIHIEELRFAVLDTNIGLLHGILLYRVGL